MELENQNLDSDFDIFVDSSSVVDQAPLSAPAASVRTPGAPHTPARTPGAPHTPGAAAPHSPRLLPPPPMPPLHEQKRTARHLCYVTHLPIPQDEYSTHETNQRLLILYGVGRHRDDVKHSIRKLTKEVLKLYSRKNCLDVTIGEVRKKDKKKDGGGSANIAGNIGSAAAGDPTATFENTCAKFRKLSYFDQHVVTQSCATQVVELVSAFSAGSSVYLPVIDHISLLLYLMESALNIGGLLDFSVQVWAEVTSWVSNKYNRYFPFARSNGRRGEFFFRMNKTNSVLVRFVSKRKKARDSREKSWVFYLYCYRLG